LGESGCMHAWSASWSQQQAQGQRRCRRALRLCTTAVQVSESEKVERLART